ncbi:MAG: TlpA disulfide reductase family protein [Bacteroidota bacterium]
MSKISILRTLLLWSFVVLAFPGFCFAQDAVQVEIYAPKLPDGSILKISWQDPLKKFIPVDLPDLNLSDGKVTRKLLTGNGDRFFLKYKDQTQGFYLEKGLIKITIPDTSLTDMVVMGSSAQRDVDLWLAAWRKEPIYVAARDAQNYMMSQTGNDKERAANTYDSVKRIFDLKKAEFNLKLIAAKPLSFVNSMLLKEVMLFIPHEKLTEVYHQLNGDARSNSYGKFIKFYLNNLSEGAMAADFAQKDTSGNLVRLKDFRGKYLLVDFWASWCIPCRQDNPNLVRAYDRFKSHNFEILGVSLDDKRKLWVDAIRKDRLTWTHVSDLKEWKNEVSVKYAIQSVPSNVLIGPDGRIIARNLRGDALIQALEKLLK